MQCESPLAQDVDSFSKFFFPVLAQCRQTSNPLARYASEESRHTRSLARSPLQSKFCWGATSKKGAPDTRARQEMPPAYGGGAGKEGSGGREEEGEERGGDLASAVILPWPRPPGASSHLRHGDEETEPLAAAAGKHSGLNRLIPAAINTAATGELGRTNPFLPLEAAAGITASKTRYS